MKHPTNETSFILFYDFKIESKKEQKRLRRSNSAVKIQKCKNVFANLTEAQLRFLVLLSEKT